VSAAAFALLAAGAWLYRDTALRGGLLRQAFDAGTAL
jgi:hypothetical protein